MKNGYRKVSKKEWYALGGFSNPRGFRRMIGGSWNYFIN